MPEPVEGPRPVILHVIANFWVGGSAQLVVDLIEGLGDRFEQPVISRDLPPTPAYTGLDLHHYPEMTEELARECLERFEPDLLHVHFLGHHDDPYSEQDWQWYDALFRVAGDSRPIVQNLNIPVEPYLSPAISRYVFVSDYVRTKFGAGAEPAETIYPGSNLALFSRENPATRDPDPDMIGMTYRLEGDKLDDASLAPFIEVTATRPGTRAVIVGGGTFYKEWKRRVDEAGQSSAIEMPGYVPFSELPGYISAMSVFLAPVHWESFGQVSVFAMGLELPVAGYDVGALSEIFGNTDLLVPPGDSAALADLVVELLGDEERRRAIGRANRARAVERFSVETMVREFDRVYGELLP